MKAEDRGTWLRGWRDAAAGFNKQERYAGEPPYHAGYGAGLVARHAAEKGPHPMKAELPVVGETCDCCRFAVAIDLDTHPEKGGFVECHRYAPRPTMNPDYDDEGSVEALVRWPEVGEDNFCGEWAAIPAPKGGGT